MFSRLFIDFLFFIFPLRIITSRSVCRAFVFRTTSMKSQLHFCRTNKFRVKYTISNSPFDCTPPLLLSWRYTEIQRLKKTSKPFVYRYYVHKYACYTFLSDKNVIFLWLFVWFFFFLILLCSIGSKSVVEMDICIINNTFKTIFFTVIAEEMFRNGCQNCTLSIDRIEMCTKVIVSTFVCFKKYNLVLLLI